MIELRHLLALLASHVQRAEIESAPSRVMQKLFSPVINGVFGGLAPLPT